MEKEPKIKKTKIKKPIIITLIIFASLLFVLLSYLLITKIVNNKIEKQKELLISQAEDIIKNIGIAETIGNSEYSIKDGKFTNDLAGSNLPDNGTVRVNEVLEISLAVSDGTYCATKGYKDGEIKVTETSNCQLLVYSDPTLNGADPILEDNMIPIVFKDNKWYMADIYEKWYDYDEKIWANMVLVKEEARSNYLNSEEYLEINEEDVLAYYVWIPRYEYKIWNISGEEKEPETIDIVFSSNDKKTINYENGKYLTHSAFTFGDDSINGFWIGKFEVSGNEDNILIKPNTKALTNKSVSTFYNSIFNMGNDNNIYGISIDSHMIKNIEWGAVSYLSYSNYGINSEIKKSTSAITGANDYKKNVDMSTTGNIYGVYDMSGGNYEYVMGYNINGTIDKSGFTELPEEKYYDAYDSYSNINYVKSKLGDAIKETIYWFNTKSFFVTTKTPWFRRGGSYKYSSEDSIFAFDDYYGSASPYTSTRAILVNK